LEKVPILVLSSRTAIKGLKSSTKAGHTPCGEKKKKKKVSGNKRGPFTWKKKVGKKRETQWICSQPETQSDGKHPGGGRGDDTERGAIVLVGFAKAGESKPTVPRAGGFF